MLSTKNVTPAMGSTYYREDNYYSKEDSEGRSKWSGKGATTLGLEGAVNPETFTHLLEGKLPTGERFRRKPTKDTYQERGGLDMTFSAPKSVSLLGLVHGDDRVKGAHDRAVQRVMDLVEQRYAKARVMKHRVRSKVGTQTMVVAQFTHDTSRSFDPQLHTHCVVLNMTQVGKKWYGLTNDDIHINKKLLGTIYQNELARELQALGYEIEARQNGQFEVAGFDPEHLRHFSQRRQNIESQISEDASWREREQACLNMRDRKQEIDRETLAAAWKQEVSELGLEFPQAQAGGIAVERHPDAVKAAVASGIDHCAEREVAFRREKIEGFVLSADLGQYSMAEIEQTIAQDDSLLGLGERVTTEAAVQREMATIHLMQDGQGRCRSMASAAQVKRQVDTGPVPLSDSQRAAVMLAATSADRFVAWQGVAGAGKTTALTHLAEIARQNAYEVKGYAPSLSAAKVLGEELGIDTETVAALVRRPVEQGERHPLWIVDEAGMVSAADARLLFEKAVEAKARVVLVGDTKQLSAVEAGNPFKSLQQAGIATAYLDQSRRQKDVSLKEAVEAVGRGQVAMAIDALERAGRVVEVHEVHRTKRLVKDYLALSPQERAKTLVIAGTNRDRRQLAEGIRAGLKAEGQLSEAREGRQFVSRDLTREQRKFAHNYKEGDVLVPVRDYKRRGLARGQAYEVVETLKDELVVQRRDGERLTVKPGFEASVYQAQAIEVAVGDVMRWRRNNKELGRRNGQEFTVQAIAGEGATIRYRNGRTEQIDLKAAQHFDYALVGTTYGSQGKTAERVLILADRTLGRESFYVGLSRARQDARIYAPSTGELLAWAQRSRAKENPLELLGQRKRLLEELEEQVGKTGGQREGGDRTQRTSGEATPSPPPSKGQEPDWKELVAQWPEKAKQAGRSSEYIRKIHVLQERMKRGEGLTKGQKGMLRQDFSRAQQRGRQMQV